MTKKRQEDATERHYAGLFGRTSIGSLLYEPSDTFFTDELQMLNAFVLYVIRYVETNPLYQFASILIDTLEYLRSLRESNLPNEVKLPTSQVLYCILDSIRADPPNAMVFKNTFYTEIANLAHSFIRDRIKVITEKVIATTQLDVCVYSFMGTGLKINNNNQEQDYRNVINLVYHYVSKYLYYQVVLDFVDRLGLPFVCIPSDKKLGYQSEINSIGKDMYDAMCGGVVGNREAREKAVSIVQSWYVNHCLLDVKHELSDYMNQFEGFN